MIRRKFMKSLLGVSILPILPKTKIKSVPELTTADYFVIEFDTIVHYNFEILLESIMDVGHVISLDGYLTTAEAACLVKESYSGKFLRRSSKDECAVYDCPHISPRESHVRRYYVFDNGAIGRVMYFPQWEVLWRDVECKKLKLIMGEK